MGGMIQDNGGRRYRRWALLLFLVGLAWGAQLAGWLDFRQLQSGLESYARTWWMPVLLVAMMVVMYAFALPASTLMLLAGLWYAPVPATTLTVLGGVAGAWAAYGLVDHLSADFLSARAQGGSAYIKRHAGFTGLCALRIMPGVPHSAINYSAGLLRLPLRTFLASTALGFAVKGFAYTSAVHEAARWDGETAWSARTLGPLVALALVLAVGGALKRHLGSSA
jgi:uncharacterized membrane protein YdjX (TVP38/TMEM64 family)